LETLGEACTKTGWRIHAYVLMNNHYHLLVETPEGNLVSGMKWLQGTYTQRFNRRHQLSGHLFQGRYKAVIIDANSPGYFDVVGAYIHLNPARSGLIRPGQEPLRQYRWSSYPWYVKGAKGGPAWLCRGRLMGAAGLKEHEGRRYENYMESRVLELAIKEGRLEWEEKWKALRRGWYVGGETFLEKLQARLGAIAARAKRESHSGGARQAHDETAARELLAKGLAALGVSRKDLRELSMGAAEKTVLAWWLRERTTVSLRWVGETLAMGHYTRVTQAVSRMKRQPGRRLNQLKDRLLKAEERAT
jgi:REP element-mobilizing transposase RayT